VIRVFITYASILVASLPALLGPRRLQAAVKSVRSRWQNGSAERWVGTVRCENSADRLSGPPFVVVEDSA
jgi:hypothetical protein